MNGILQHVSGGYPPLHFHHIGLACRDLHKETRDLGLLGYVPETEEFIDPIQGIRGRFLLGPGPRLELVAPLTDDGVLTPWLKNKTKLYHMGFTVEYLDEAISAFVRAHAKLVVPPVRAVGFTGERIAFLMLRNLLLIELINGGSTSGEQVIA